MKAAPHFVACCFRSSVIALTNVGLVVFVCAWMSLGCGPGAIKVQPADTTAFTQLLEAEVLFGARRPAHWMERSVRGDSPDKNERVLDDAKLAEPYTPSGTESFWPSRYHLGYAALRLLREYYAAAHPGHRVLASDELVEIVDAAGGNTYAVNDFDRDRHLDISDVEGRFVFEVVPSGQTHWEAGKKKVDWHLLLLNTAMIGVPEFKLGTGFSGEIGVRFAEKAPPWKLTWSTSDGVVQYNWHVLTVKKATEDACRKAYLDNQWHEPTHPEMVRFGRALHEVVERLVQAREKLGPTRATTTMPMLPGKTIADYLRSVAWWSANDEGIARLLPIMREPPPPPPPVQVRPDPRLVAQTAGGGASRKMHPGATSPNGPVVPPHPSAPEAYTLDGTFGSMPWQFFLGYSAHRAIAYRYWALHKGLLDTVFRNHISIATIVDETGGDEALLDWSDADLRPDITHTTTRIPEQFVFEIKPPGDVHLAKGKEKLALYIGALNVGMARTAKVFVPGPNDSGELWIMFKRGELIWRLTWETTAPGLLQYKWDKPNTADSNDINVREEAWRQAFKDGRWTDISKREMEDNAEELFNAVEGMVLRRDVLGNFRDAVTVAVEGIGAAAEVALSARLWNHIDTAPRLVPIIRIPAPGTQPIPRSKPLPPINARPLGPDKRMTPNSARPASPGKTPSGPKPASRN